MLTFVVGLVAAAAGGNLARCRYMWAQETVRYISLLVRV